MEREVDLNFKIKRKQKYRGGGYKCDLSWDGEVILPKVVLPLDLYKALMLKKNHEDEDWLTNGRTKLIIE